MSDYLIHTFVEQNKPQQVIYMNLLQAAAVATLQQQGVAPPASLSVALTDDAHMRQLNQQFMGVDAPTDVLSFPNEEPDPDDDMPYLGDVVISIVQAQGQAAAGGHTVGDELQLLTVHGCLHLLGHDHSNPSNKAKMWAAQATILQQLGAGITGPAASNS